MDGIQIGEYVIYPAFFALIIGVPIGLLILVLIISSIKKSKAESKLFKISSWQKAELPYIIDDALKQTDNLDLSDEELAGLKKFKNYIKKEKFWNLDKIQNIYPSLPRLMYEICVDDLEMSYLEGDIDRAILLINAVDAINGRCEMNGNKMIWMDEDLVSFTEPGLDKYDSVVKGLWQWILYDVLDKQFPEDEDYIPERYEMFQDYMKRISRIDVEDAAAKIIEVGGIKDMPVETLDIVIKFFIWYLGYSSAERENDVISEATKYYLRAIACALDKNSYPDIIKSLL